MTTGRINQVTIVRRGTGQPLVFRAEEISSYVWSAGSRARGAAPHARPSAGLGAMPHPLSPFEFPRARSAGGKRTLKSTPDTPPTQPQEEAQPAEPAIARFAR